jgi:hypothetical protein
MSVSISPNRSRRILASAAATALAIGGLVALNPVAAQAKTVDWLDTQNPIPMAGCFGAPGSATGSVTKVGTTAGTWKIAITGNTGDFEFRARYGYLDTKTNKVLFAKKRVDPAGAPTTYGPDTVSASQLVIYRLDVVDPATAQLVYTSAGAVGCD